MDREKILEIVHVINMITLQNISGKYHVTVVGDNIWCRELVQTESIRKSWLCSYSVTVLYTYTHIYTYHCVVTLSLIGQPPRPYQAAAGWKITPGWFILSGLFAIWRKRCRVIAKNKQFKREAYGSYITIGDFNARSRYKQLYIWNTIVPDKPHAKVD